MALYAHNSLDCLVVSWAVRRVGAIPVSVNPRLTGAELAYIIDDSEAVAVFLTGDLAPLAEGLRLGMPAVRTWIAMDGDRRTWAEHLDDLVAGGRSDALPAIGTHGVPASMLYTAGTTGRPKGVLRRSVDPATARALLSGFDLADAAHVHLLAGPLYHLAPEGFVRLTQLSGGTVIVLPRFDPEAALAAIDRHRCTSTFMAPTLLKRIVDLPAEVRARHDVSSMRVIVTAAAPCPMKVKDDVLAMFGPALYEFYGSTELGLNTLLRPEDVQRKPGSCGRAAPGIELAILDQDGRPLPAGTPGDLYVRRHPGAFDEYWKNPEATRETSRGDWLTVGDVAWMDDEG